MSAVHKSESPATTGLNAIFTTLCADSNPEIKAKATLIAKFALIGHAVKAYPAGDFLVNKWGMSRHCRDFAALEVFAIQVGIK